MSFITWIAIYIMVWFIVLMPILNSGTTTLSQAGEKPTDGSDLASPVKPDLKRKFILTSQISAGIVLCMLLAYAILSLAPFQKLFNA